jgi:hypothetical protein
VRKGDSGKLRRIKGATDRTGALAGRWEPSSDIGGLILRPRYWLLESTKGFGFTSHVVESTFLASGGCSDGALRFG